jgi:hypothetical protein
VRPAGRRIAGKAALTLALILNECIATDADFALNRLSAPG